MSSSANHRSGYSGCGFGLLIVALMLLFGGKNSDGEPRPGLIARMFSAPAPTESPYEDRDDVLNMGAFFVNSDYLSYGYDADTGADEAQIHYDVSSNYSPELFTDDGFCLEPVLFVTETISESGHSYDADTFYFSLHLDKPRRIKSIRITVGDHWIEYDGANDKAYETYNLGVNAGDHDFIKKLVSASKIKVRLKDSDGENHYFYPTSVNRQMLSDMYVVCMQYGFFD